MPETARDRTDPRIQQVSFFLPNRLGALRRALALLEERRLRIGGISVLEAADHAVVRIVVDGPSAAVEILAAEGYGACETEVLGVALPADHPFGVQRVLQVLMSGEVNLEYAYTLLLRSDGRPVLVLQVDDQGMAVRVLSSHGIEVLGQDQLSW